MCRCRDAPLGEGTRENPLTIVEEESEEREMIPQGVERVDILCDTNLTLLCSEGRSMGKGKEREVTPQGGGIGIL